MPSENAGGTLKADDSLSTISLNDASGNYSGVYVTLVNNTISDAALTECNVESLSIYENDNNTETNSIGILTIGAKTDKKTLVDALGDTSYDYISDDKTYESYEWEYTDGGYDITARVDISDGVITEVSINMYSTN